MTSRRRRTSTFSAGSARTGSQPFGRPDDLGFADQPGHPAILPDGRIVLAWVDRFGTASIRARARGGVDAPFEDATEVVVYVLEGLGGWSLARRLTATTGEALVEMGTWSYGLAFAEALPDGDIGIVHYAAGADGGTDIRWARLRLDS